MRRRKRSIKSGRGSTCGEGAETGRQYPDRHTLSHSSDKTFLPCLQDKHCLSPLTVMRDFSIKTPQQLGAVLKGYRKERGLTQEAMGFKVGLAQKAVSQIESDPGRAGLARVFKLLAALELEVVLRPRGHSSRRSEW